MTVTVTEFKSFVISLRHPWFWYEGGAREQGTLREMKTSWEGVKMEALNRLGGRKSVLSCLDLGCK